MRSLTSHKGPEGMPNENTMTISQQNQRNGGRR